MDLVFLLGLTSTLWSLQDRAIPDFSIIILNDLFALNDKVAILIFTISFGCCAFASL